MYRVLSCLATEHDPWLVGLAVLVCIATALTAFMMYAIASDNRDHRRLFWAALTGACAGSGIWATHFVAMLAYQGSLPTHYEPIATLASLIIAVGLAACAFAISAGGNLWWAGLGGLVLGAAIGSMHYVGMQALIVPGTLVWEGPLIAASLMLGLIIAPAAMLGFHLKTGISAILIGGALLTLAICALHFTAMGAVTILPDPTLSSYGSINRLHLALAVATVTLIVLSVALASALIQRANIRCETALRDQNHLFETALRYLPVGLSMFDAEQRLIMCNPAYRTLYGLSDGETRPGTEFSGIVLDHVKRESGAGNETRLDGARSWLAEHFSKLERGRDFSETVQLSDGRTILKKVGPIAGGGWVDVQEDITALRHSDERIEWLARHDALTEIANRFQFRERLEREFASYDPRCGFALHWIDLDYFKEINDRYGHQVGDGFLKSVAIRLASNLRAGDLVGRLGGDEFAILQMGTGRKDLVQGLASRILTSVAQPHDVLGYKLVANASIGIALAPDHGQNPDQLFASADAALYRAKSRGRGVAVLYEKSSGETPAANPLRAELYEAVDGHQLILHYQPIIDLRQGRVTSFEALMRWKHPNRGMLPPSEFIHLAEETRLIIPMGKWALTQACRDCNCWPDPIAVAVNLSAMQIEDHDIYEVVTEALAASGLEPRRLQLEVTETVLVRDRVRAQALLRKLSALGITITLDDFGTCFATLDYLRNLPFRKLKIDRSFVHDLPGDRSCAAIVKSVADLARDLGMRSVAEGVETAANLAAVRSAGCDAVQGFYFTPPVPARAVVRTISQCALRLRAADETIIVPMRPHHAA